MVCYCNRRYVRVTTQAGKKRPTTLLDLTDMLAVEMYVARGDSLTNARLSLPTCARPCALRRGVEAFTHMARNRATEGRTPRAGLDDNHVVMILPGDQVIPGCWGTETSAEDPASLLYDDDIPTPPPFSMTMTLQYRNGCPSLRLSRYLPSPCPVRRRVAPLAFALALTFTTHHVHDTVSTTAPLRAPRSPLPTILTLQALRLVQTRP